MKSYFRISVLLPCFLLLFGTSGGLFAKTAESKKYQTEFKKAKNRAISEFKKQEKNELKVFRNQQDLQAKAWRENARKERRAYFEANLHAPDRRKYIQDYLARKSEFDQLQRDELGAKRIELHEKERLLQEHWSQEEKLLEESLATGAEINRAGWH